MEKPRTQEVATDIEVVMALIQHIEQPCGTSHGHIRDFYLREAERLLPTITDLGARFLLGETIVRYS